MKYCNKCGFKLVSNAKYCSKCGHKIESLNEEVIDSSTYNERDTGAFYRAEESNNNLFSDKSGNFKKQDNNNKINNSEALNEPLISVFISFFRYFIGIVCLLSGIFNFSLVYILTGISLLPLTYKFVAKRLELEDFGTKVLKVIAVILPIILFFTSVPAEEPTEIQIINSKSSISIGEVIELKAKTDVDGYDTSNFSWKSSNVSVASIVNGRLFGVSEGISVISVESENGISSEFTLTVKHIPPSDISITGPDSAYTGTSFKLNTVVLPNNATIKNLEWQSSNPSVATVDQYGNVTAISKGKTTIKVKESNIIAEYPITIYQSLDSLSLSKSDFNLKVGASTSLTYTISPKSASDSPIEWRSSNQSIATVVNGKVTGIASGKSIITLIAGNKTISTSVIVQKKSPISVVNFRYTRNTAGGVEWTFRLRNNTNKTINYITLVWYNFNAVGDPVYDEITGKNYHGVKFTGPLKAGATTTTRRTTNLFYSYSYKSSVFTNAKIEYADGTTETIKIEDFVFLYDFAVTR